MQIHKGMLSVQRTLLCRLMVYSRVTTSAMAERVFLPVVLTLLDIFFEFVSLADKTKISQVTGIRNTN